MNVNLRIGDLFLIRAALRYAAANVDDLCEAFRCNNESENMDGSIEVDENIIISPTCDDLNKLADKFSLHSRPKFYTYPIGTVFNTKAARWKKTGNEEAEVVWSALEQFPIGSRHPMDPNRDDIIPINVPEACDMGERKLWITKENPCTPDTQGLNEECSPRGKNEEN